MKLKPYRELLGMAKEAVEATLAPIRASQMRKRAELKIAELDEKIVTQQAKVQELCSKHPIDFDAVVSALDDLALAERKRKQLEKIVAEMFPEDA